MALERLKSFLFGHIQRIDIHCNNATIGEKMKSCVRASFQCFDVSVPVVVKQSERGVEFVMVHYCRGLFRAAHADVMVIS